MKFFGKQNGDFNISPQSYYLKWRKVKGLTKAFLGPWDYSKKKTKTFKYGANRTKALSEE